MSQKEKIAQKIDLGFVSVQMIKPKIVCINVQIEEIISVEKGILILETIKNLVGDDYHATIVNSSTLHAPSKEFFKFIVSQRNLEKDKTLARAIIATNIATRIDSQNFICFFKPLTPTKLFSNMEEAIAWIEPQLKTN